MRHHAGRVLAGTTAAMLAMPGAQAAAQSLDELRGQVFSLEQRIDELENEGRVRVANGTIVEFGGYVKLDFTYDFKQGQGDTTSNSALVPGAPDDGGFNAHARQSRFWFTTSSDTASGPLNTKLEFDFFGGGGNQAFSNSFQPRLRHAYGTWNGWLAGQTWTTFMPIEVYPNTLDFQGPSGIPFVRQAQLRYTFPAAGNVKVSLALESSEFTGRNAAGPVGQTTGTSSGVNADIDTLPDLVAAAVWQQGDALLRGSVVLRKLEAPSNLGGDDDTGWGINLAGGVPLWAGGRLVGSVTYGDGVGRYIIDGFAQDAFIDSAGNLRTIEALGATVQVTHQFSDRLTGGLAYGYYDVNDTFSPTDTETLQTLHASLFYNPTERLTVGGEVSWGSRELANGKTADAVRLQTSVQFNF